MPTTLQASLVARLDRIASVKDLAQIGAVIGREFSHEVIGAVVDLAPRDLNATLERLSASGLISRRGTPPDATSSFRHALVRDAAYGTLLKSRRQQLHASIAKLLVERFPTMADSQPEVVAHHFTEAALGSEAIVYWLKAGRLASARSANREATKSFERALSVLESLPESPSTLEQAFEIRLELRPVLTQLGEIRQALQLLRQAEALAERLNDDHRRGQVCAFMTNVHSLLGELDEALVTGIRALEIAARLGDLRLSIPARTYLEVAHHWRGDYVRVVELATDNLAALPADWVYESFGSTAPASVYDRSWLALSLAELGRFAEASEHAAEAIRLSDPTQHGFTISLAYRAACTLHLLKGAWPQARTLIARWIGAVRTANVILHLPYALATSAWLLAQLGETGEALDLVREGEQLALETRGTVATRGWTCRSLGRAFLLLGRLDEARRWCDHAVEFSMVQAGFMAYALHLLGDIAIHPEQFDAERGEAHFREALALAEPRGMRPLVAHCRLGLGELHARSGNQQEAREYLTTAAAAYREMDMRFWLGQAEADIGQLG
jgi:tetratricopeptide (TPR) repeat protein